MMRSLIETALKKARTEDHITDTHLEEVLKDVKARILAIGIGGAGNNTTTRLMKAGIDGAETLAVNTDAQDLLHTESHYKLLIGKELTGGLGAGNDPEVGEAAAKENIDDIRNAVRADMVFITCGLGGGTGTGAAPVFAEAAKKQKALTVSIVTLPFRVEGKKRQENAARGLRKLLEVSDTVIVIPNDRLLEFAPDLSISEAFKVADEVLIRGVKGIAELVTRPGLVNLDFADVRTIMKNRGVAIIAMGESDNNDRAVDAVENALNNPLLDVDIEGANAALINVNGSSDMTLREAQTAVKVVSDKLQPDAEIIWGAIIDDSLKDKVQVIIIVSGVKSPYIFGANGEKINNLGKDLGLEEL